ncbi:MAG: galactokinase [Leptonema sp. (in: bacteria)]
MDTKNILINNFIKIFNKNPSKFFFAPGRINFIGEHIDYNGGKVLPFAIDKGIYAAVHLENNSKNKVIHMYSELDKKIYTINLEEEVEKIRNSKLWIRYPIGVFEYLKDSLQNFEIWIYYFYDLPIGSGLSSSASMEVLTGYIVKSLIIREEPIDRVELARQCQKVENEFVGVQCGIMDQFAVAMGKKDHFILLDTFSLEYEYINFFYPEIDIIVINSNVPRELATSQYNERLRECKQALEILSKKHNTKNLVDAPEKSVQEIQQENLKKRALHVINENRRVQNLISILKESKEDVLKETTLQNIGNLLYESHDSLKDLYEVSCKELDLIVEESKKLEGVFGSRMTGAGFGGCAITLLKKGYFENYKRQLQSIYKHKTNLEADIFTVQISDGVKLYEF